MKFTDDPHVRETLGFLMTREIAHFQQFNAALGPWPQGEHWSSIGDPDSHVRQTRGEVEEKPEGTKLTMEGMKRKDQDLSRIRSTEVKSAMRNGMQQGSEY